MIFGVQKILSLPTMITGTMEITIFGSTKRLKQPCNLMSLDIITRDSQSLRINALVVPHICDVIHSGPSGVVMRQYPHFVDLNLADDGEKGMMTVDLLNEADYYWLMVSGMSKYKEGIQVPTS